MARHRSLELEHKNPLIFTTELLPSETPFILYDFDKKVIPKDIDTSTTKFIKHLSEYLETQKIGQIKAFIVNEDYIDERHRQVIFSQDYFNQKYLKKHPSNELKDFKEYFCERICKGSIEPINYISENIYKRYDPKISETKSCLAKTVLQGLIIFRDELKIDHPETDYFNKIDALHKEELRVRKEKNKELRKKGIKPSDMKFDEFKYCSKTSLRDYLDSIKDNYNNYIDKEKNSLSRLLDALHKEEIRLRKEKKKELSKKGIKPSDMKFDEFQYTGKKLIIDRIAKLEKAETATDLFKLLPSDWMYLYEIMNY